MMRPKLPDPHRPVDLWPPLAWAYLGDVVYDWYIRWHVLCDANLRPKQLHQRTTKYVSAAAQSISLAAILSELTEKEKEIVQRGRNAKSNHTAKNASIFEYTQATGFEALLGYLYGHGQEDRLMALMARAKDAIDLNEVGKAP